MSAHRPRPSGRLRAGVPAGRRAACRGDRGAAPAGRLLANLRAMARRSGSLPCCAPIDDAPRRPRRSDRAAHRDRRRAMLATLDAPALASPGVDACGTLVVDDSPTMRRLLRQMPRHGPGLRRSWPRPRDGAEALAPVPKPRPTYLLLDIEMPGMDGVAMLRHWALAGVGAVLVVSSATAPGSALARELRRLGAAAGSRQALGRALGGPRGTPRRGAARRRAPRGRTARAGGRGMIDNELREQFAAESEEHLDTIERLLGAGARDRASVDSLFRAFHSLKGMSGALGAGGMLAVAHRCEDILGLARLGQRGGGAGGGRRADRRGGHPAPPARRADRGRPRRRRAGGVAPRVSPRSPRRQPPRRPSPPPATAARPRRRATSRCWRRSRARSRPNSPPLASGPSAEAAGLAGELIELARAADAGAPRRRCSRPCAAGTGPRRCRCWAICAGGSPPSPRSPARTPARRRCSRALAARVGEAGLPARPRPAGGRRSRKATARKWSRAAREAGRIAAAIGRTALEELLLTIEDLWDRPGEPDAVAAVMARRALIAGRLRAIAEDGYRGPRTRAGAGPAAPGSPRRARHSRGIRRGAGRRRARSAPPMRSPPGVRSIARGSARSRRSSGRPRCSNG